MSFAGCVLHISAVRTQQNPSGSQGQAMVRLVVEGDAGDLVHENPAPPCNSRDPGHFRKMEGEQIIAAPTLIKRLPLPLRRFIGGMSQTGRIILGLDLRKNAEGTKG